MLLSGSRYFRGTTTFETLRYVIMSPILFISSCIEGKKKNAEPKEMITPALEKALTKQGIKLCLHFFGFITELDLKANLLLQLFFFFLFFLHNFAARCC